MDMSKFLRIRHNAVAAYNELEDLSVQLGNEHVKNELQKGKQLLLEDSFKLVVVGEFSRGKSTFINAMLGQKVLPAKSDPTTTMINRISYGNKKKFILHYRDDTPTTEIDEANFKNIVAEDFDEYKSSESPCSEVNRIAYAEIHYPLDICKNGIELIDTPGTNDLDQVREEITFKFIPEADAAIFLLSAEQILSGNEVDFLKERIIRNDISKIFFVINFKDRLGNPDVDGQKIIHLAEWELKKYVPTPRIYLVSSKLALNFRLAHSSEKFKGKLPSNFEDTGFVEFECDLAEYLINEKSSDKIKKYVKRAIHLGEDLIMQTIRVEQSSLGFDSARLHQQIEQFKPQLEKIQYESHRLFDNLEFRLKMLIQNFTRKYEFGLEDISRHAQSVLNSYSGELRAESVAHAIELAIAPLQQQNEISLRNEITDQLETEIQSVKSKLQSIFKEETKNQSLIVIKGEESRALAVQSQGFTLDPISTEDTSLIGSGLILGGLVVAIHVPFIAIPVAIFGGRHFLQQFENYRRENFISKVSVQIRERYAKIIPQQVKQFESALNNQVMNLIDSFKKEIDGKVSAVEMQLDRLLSERKRTEQNETTRRAELKVFEQKIRDLQRKLGNMP